MNFLSNSTIGNNRSKKLEEKEILKNHSSNALLNENKDITSSKSDPVKETSNEIRKLIGNHLDTQILTEYTKGQEDVKNNSFYANNYLSTSQIYKIKSINENEIPKAKRNISDFLQQISRETNENDCLMYEKNNFSPNSVEEPSEKKDKSFLEILRSEANKIENQSSSESISSSSNDNCKSNDDSKIYKNGNEHNLKSNKGSNSSEESIIKANYFNDNTGPDRENFEYYKHCKSVSIEPINNNNNLSYHSKPANNDDFFENTILYNKKYHFERNDKGSVDVDLEKNKDQSSKNNLKQDLPKPDGQMIKADVAIYKNKSFNDFNKPLNPYVACINEYRINNIQNGLYDNRYTSFLKYRAPQSIFKAAGIYFHDRNQKVLEAAVGLLKLKRIFIDKTYREQGYKYKSDLQLKVLNEILEITPYPGSQTRDTLAILLNLNPRSVQIWFQNARQGSEKQLSREELKNHRGKNHIDLRKVVAIFIKYTQRS